MKTDNTDKSVNEKTRQKLKLLGLSDDDSEDDFDNSVGSAIDHSSETSSSPELEPQEEIPDLQESPDIPETPDHPETPDLPETPDHPETPEDPPEPTEPPKKIDEEIVVPETREEYDKRVDKLEETIKNLQQQMAEGNDHIAYEMKMRKKEELNENLRDVLSSRNI